MSLESDLRRSRDGSLRATRRDTSAAPAVLVADGGLGQSRSALAAVRALGQVGYQVAVTVSGRYSLAAASRYCSRVVHTPTADEPGFATAVRAETRRRNYVGVLPASDTAILALSAPGRRLVDKEILSRLAAAAGLSVPVGRTFRTVADLLSAAGGLDYPCVVKAAAKTSMNMPPAQRMDRPGELVHLRDATGPFIVQPYLPGAMHAVAGVMWQGRMVAAVHQSYLRLWPPVLGDACAAITTAPDRELEEKLEGLLADFDGIFQAEFVGSTLLDLNPRVYGSMSLAVSAGVNLVDIYLALLRGEEVPTVRARAGVHYRWREGDARHLLRGRHGRLAVTAAVSELRQLVTGRSARLLDPGPGIARFRYVLHRVRARASVSARAISDRR